MNRLLELAQLPSSELNPRAEAIRENAKHWLSIDYEAISASLEIEINTEMSPLVINKVLTGRLSEMGKAERADVPAFVWDYLSALDVTGLGNYEKFHPNAKTTLLPYTVRKLDGETVSLQPKGIEVKDMMSELGRQARWERWCRVHNPKVSFDTSKGAPVIKAEAFIPWSERELEDIFSGFYDEH